MSYSNYYQEIVLLYQALWKASEIDFKLEIGNRIKSELESLVQKNDKKIPLRTKCNFENVQKVRSVGVNPDIMWCDID